MLESRQQEAREALRKFSKVLTEPTSPDEQSPYSPYFKYSLRGVCTAPHITYVLRPSHDSKSEDLIDLEESSPSPWQWWRISFSKDDAKAQHDRNSDSRKKAAPPPNTDIIGYTASKVREIEVLKATRESTNALLVYANANAVGFASQPLPPSLQVWTVTCLATYFGMSIGCVINW